VATPTLIFCANGNRRFAGEALAAGFRYGVQLPGTVYFPIYFADQNWKKPNRQRYMACLREHRPTMATVLDWERENQLAEVLDWAEEAAQYVRQVLLIPKVQGGIGRLPRRIGGRDVVLGYSVPTRFGGTELPIWDFAGWPVHLLGGTPHKQMHYWRHLVPLCEVVSVDGNFATRMATTGCQFWVPGTARHASNRWWPTLMEADGKRWDKDGPYEAFRRSCENIIAAWRQLCGVEVPA
jgi:hypothetical protein